MQAEPQLDSAEARKWRRREVGMFAQVDDRLPPFVSLYLAPPHLVNHLPLKS